MKFWKASGYRETISPISGLVAAGFCITFRLLFFRFYRRAGFCSSTFFLSGFCFSRCFLFTARPVGSFAVAAILGERFGEHVKSQPPGQGSGLGQSDPDSLAEEISASRRLANYGVIVFDKAKAFKPQCAHGHEAIRTGVI